MAIKIMSDICGKEIKGKWNTIKGYSNTIIGSFQIFDRTLCDKCFADIREKTLKK